MSGTRFVSRARVSGRCEGRRHTVKILGIGRFMRWFLVGLVALITFAAIMGRHMMNEFRASERRAHAPSSEPTVKQAPVDRRSMP